MQQAQLTRQVEEISEDLDLAVTLEPAPIYTDEVIGTFLRELESSPPDALLLFNFWNTFSAKIVPIVDAFNGPVIVYHPVGANHQLPPKKLDTAARTQYIHSIENWGALERGLRALNAHNRMKQSRLLRVSGRIKEETDAPEPLFGTAIHGVITMIVWANALGSACLIRLPASACKAIGVVLACPVLLPCLMLDPDGDRFPKWFQVSSFFLNGLVWAFLILLAAIFIKHLRQCRQREGNT